MRWSPLEKLCGSLAGSLILIYLASFALFCLHAPREAYFGFSAVFTLMGILSLGQLAAFFRHRLTRRVILAYLVVAVWEFGHLAMVRSFSGGVWSGDWREHYDRMCYFLNLRPRNFLFLGIYQLSARPPMMNLICAFFCRQVGLSFEAYSLCCLFLNGLAFIPCCLLLRLFRARGLRNVFPLAILFMLNPSIVENATYTVTKALTAGLVVMGVCFYLRALREKTAVGGPSRMIAAALCLASGVLTHYSAGPYAVAVAIHYLWTLIRGRLRFREAILAGGAGAILLATWFSWSIVTYGLHTSFLSNSTAINMATVPPGDSVRLFLYKIFVNFVPHPLHRANARLFPPGWNRNNLRDYFFMMSQQTLPMMIGSTGGIVAIGLFLTAKKGLHREKQFWSYFVIFTYIIGTLSDPEWPVYGSAFATAQPLALMGVVLVAARLFDLPAPLFWLVIAGSAIDYAWGIFLQFYQESFTYPTFTDTQGNVAVYPDPSLGINGAVDYQQKLNYHFTFWGDHLAGIASLLEVASVLIALAALWILIRLRRTRDRKSKELTHLVGS